jgi:outer membrane protein TolC
MRVALALSVAVWMGVVSAAAIAETPRPLTLKEAIRIAQRHHPTVEGQRGQATAAHGRQEQALARLLPFVEGGASYAPTTPNFVVTPAQARTVLASAGKDTVVDTAGAPVVVTCRTPGVGNCAAIAAPPNLWTPQSFWTAQVGLSWTAWDWGRSLYGYGGARDLASASDVGVRAAELDVTLQVQLAFFGALAADEQVAVAQDAVKNYRAHTAQTRGLHESGLRTGIDVATAESAQASIEIALARALAAREAAAAQLGVALGEDHPGGWQLVPEPAAFELQPQDAERAEAPIATLVDAAAAQRPDLEQLRLEERGYGAAVSSTRGSYLPALTLSLSPTWGGQSLSTLVPNLTWMVSLGYPVGGMSPLLVHGQTREAEGLLVGVRAQRRAALDAVRGETLASRALLVAARDEVRFARTLVESAARQRGLAEGRYQTGVGNVIELYDALLTDVSARSQLVQAHLDLASARARLKHALGEAP